MRSQRVAWLMFGTAVLLWLVVVFGGMYVGMHFILKHW